MINKNISHYKILEKLGEGGMGVVYKAHDTKLDRLVALKFLPHHLDVTDSEKARFLQEARAASAVTHPNVCIIYDIVEEGEEQFIVMECVEGKTLRQLIPLQKTQDAITYALQIGEALQEAHSKGIVHRDIKADNIMVNTKNQIKVMDFGLAKLKGSLKLTKTSSTVGTLAYMAPEQIQGGEVDARSDIFSFGVVLYEMLTGHLPFRGEHEAAMMYSILNEEPEPIQKYIPEVSSEMMHIFNRALEKEPEDRYQSVSDMLIDIRRLKKQTSKVSRIIPRFQTSPQPTEIPQVQPPQLSVGFAKILKNKYLFIGTGVLLVILILALYFIFFASPSASLNPNMSLRILQIPFTTISYPGLSPDGNWVAFPAMDSNEKWDIYFMNTTSGEPKRITYDSCVAIERADISPDGSQIIYNRFTGDRPPEIVLISSLGGEEKILAENAILPCWQPDGKRIFFERGLYTPVKSKSGKMEFWSVNANGADEKLEYIDSISTVGRFSLSVSPKGDAIVWQRSFFEDYQFQELCVFNLQTKKEHQLTFDKKNIDEVCWARNDQIIFSSNRNGNSNLWMISALGGTPVQITKGSGPDLGMKISADCKKLLHFQRQTISNIWIGSLRDGSIKQITFDERNRGTPDFSPDGKRIAFGMQDPDPMKSEVNIHIVNRDGSNRKQLTFTKEITAFPKWSPNGKWISFARFGRDILNNTGSYRSYIVEVTRPGTEKFITNGRTLWLNDNEIQTYTEGKSWIVSVETGEKRHFYKDSTQAIPVLKGKYILYRDMRVGGVWIVETKDFKSKVSRLLIPSSSSVLYNPYLNFLIESSSNGKLWKIFLPDGKREKIPHTFHKLIVGSFYSALSIDGNEIVYVDENDRGKLVLIENLFE